jgi:di/tricarboxylate transporter
LPGSQPGTRWSRCRVPKCITGTKIADRYGTSPYKQLLAVLGLSGGAAGFINNTPVVAVMIPMVNTLSNRTGISPSKLLMPVLYVAMLGGMLTLIGTSTSILASDISGRIIDQPFSMFEFTQLGVLVLGTGVVYFATVGRLLIPECIEMGDELVDEFEMAEYLTEVVVTDESHLAGKTVDESFTELDVDAELIQVIRGDQVFTEPLARPGDRPR